MGVISDEMSVSSESSEEEQVLLIMPGNKRGRPRKERPLVDRTKRRVDADTFYHRQNAKLHILPRILKTDLRWCYPGMYSNVMNSLNPTMVRSFFMRFCAADCSVADYVPSVLFGAPLSSAEGVQATAAFIAKVLDGIPDATGKRLESRIVRRSGQSTSSVVMTSRLLGTMMLPVKQGGGQGQVVLKTIKIDADVSTVLHLTADHRIQQIVFTAKLN